MAHYTLGKYVFNEIETFTTQFKKIFKNKEKYFQEWTQYRKDVFSYSTVCALGHNLAFNSPEIPTKMSSANCIHTMLYSPIHGGSVHVKLVPDMLPSTGVDDVTIDVQVGKMITILVNDPRFQDYKHNFLQYICSGYMYINPRNSVPYEAVFNTNDRCQSYLYDIPPTSTVIPIISTDTNFPKEGSLHEKEFQACKCIVNTAIGGESLEFALKNAPLPAFYQTFLEDTTFFSMCKGMYFLGKEFGFVHNDAHTGNVLYDNNNKSFTLIDYGRSYINVIDDSDNIYAQEKTKFGLLNGYKNPYSAFSFIKSTKFDEKYVHLASQLPVMNDIACLCYNIWKCIHTHKDEKVTAIKESIFNLDNGTIILPGTYITCVELTSVINQVKEVNIRVLMVGLLWMRMYIETAVKTYGYTQGNVKLTHIEATPRNQDTLLWSSGQILPGHFNQLKGAFDEKLKGEKFYELLQKVFETGPIPMTGLQSGGFACKPNHKPIALYQDLITQLGKLEDITAVKQMLQNMSCAPQSLEELFKSATPVSTTEELVPTSVPPTEELVPTSVPIAEGQSTSKYRGIFKTDSVSFRRAPLLTQGQAAFMLTQYAGTYRNSVAYAQECLDKQLQERGW